MRTFPATTAFRYQEDYPLALQQQRAIDAVEAPRRRQSQRLAWAAAAGGLLIVATFLAIRMRQSSLLTR